MSILITLLIGVLILGGIFYLLDYLPLKPPWAMAARVIIVLIAICWLLSMLPGSHVSF